MAVIIAISFGLRAFVKDKISTKRDITILSSVPNITNVTEIRVTNTKENRDKLFEMLEDDNISILFDMMYEDVDTKELVMSPVIESDKLNEFIHKVDTVDKFNNMIEDYILDESPIYKSPVVNDSKKINCYGYTLLTMSFLENHLSDKYKYKVIQDHVRPHTYLELYDKETGEHLSRIDLTIQNRLRVNDR